MRGTASSPSTKGKSRKKKKKNHLLDSGRLAAERGGGEALATT